MRLSLFHFLFYKNLIRSKSNGLKLQSTLYISCKWSQFKIDFSGGALELTMEILHLFKFFIHVQILMDYTKKNLKKKNYVKIRMMR